MSIVLIKAIYMLLYMGYVFTFLWVNGIYKRFKVVVEL